METVECPSSKRVKKDTLSPSFNDQTVKENGTPMSNDTHPCTNNDKCDDAVKEHRSFAKNESTAPTPKKNNGPVSLGTCASEKMKNFTTTNSPSPGKLTPPEAVSIAEQRLKKRDARKVGLVDRIQEKIALWVARSPSPSTDDLNPNVTNSEDDTSEHEDIKQAFLEKERDATSKTPKEIDSSENVDIYSDQSETNCNSRKLIHITGSHTLAKSDQNNGKQKDLLAGAKPIQEGTKESVNKILQAFNMSKSHPKVVLRKLVFTSEENSSCQSQQTNGLTESELIKTEPIESENGMDSVNSVAQLAEAEKFTITHMELYPDNDKESRAKSVTAPLVKLLTNQARKRKPTSTIKKGMNPSVKPSAETSVKALAETSDSPSVETSVKPSGESSVKPPDVPPANPSSSGASTEPAVGVASPTLSTVGSPSASAVASPFASTVIPASTIASCVTATPTVESASVESTAEPLAKPTAGLEAKPSAVLLLQTANEKAVETTAETKSGHSSKNSDPIKTDKVSVNSNQEKTVGKEGANQESTSMKTVHSKINIVHRSFSIRAKPISELRDPPSKKQKPLSFQSSNRRKSDLGNISETSLSVSTGKESDSSCGDNSRNNDQQLAVTSDGHPDVTVCLENPTSKSLKEPEKLSVGSSSESGTAVNNSVSHTVISTKVCLC